jgi:FAD/FMN-containing dehydrogenase/Fe-S oxidoreductase
MDAERKRVEDDLRGAVAGEVLCDPLTSQLYASDASIYQLSPLGVVRPRSAQDVVTCVRYAQEHQLTLHPRGAGSGVAGESLGRGLILDFSRFMHRWQSAADGHHVRVQPGVVLAELNRELAKDRRLYGPDPATRSVTTMGSVINVDASGSHYLRYGSARDTIESLQVVTAGGELLHFDAHTAPYVGAEGHLARGVERIVRQYEAPLRAHRQRSVLPRGAYRLDDVVQLGRVQLARLLAGSEGTLGIVTEATLRTEPMPRHRAVALLFFRRLEAAARGALAAVRQGVVACDVMDRRLMEIARETDARYEQLIPRDAEALMLTELQGDSLPELRDRLAALVDELCTTPGMAFASSTTLQPRERDLFWRLSRRVIPRVYRLKGDSRALPFVEDFSVAPESLPRVLSEIQVALRAEQVTALVFAHAGHGQLHIRPFLDLADRRDQRRVRALSERLSRVVWDHGGTVSGEHASGLSRSHLLPEQYGDLWPAMGEVKKLFDPTSLLNPGKITGAVVQHADENLRPVQAQLAIHGDADSEASVAAGSLLEEAEIAGRQLTVLQHWPAGAGIERTTRQCNGCGRCRTTAPQQRQCPVFRIAPSEEAAPRAKANLLRSVLTGDLDPTALTSERAKEVTDLCFNCHQCRLECPASVDIPKIVTEMKGQYVATNGLSLSDLLFCRLDLIAPFLSRFSLPVNWMLQNRPMRWALERAFGLAAARKLPRVTSRTFLRYAARRKLTRPIRHSGPKVIYFVDYFANHHDPSVGRALVEVLLHNQIGIYVPPKQVPSGMARITAGDLKGARKLARKNVRMLAEAVRQGYQIVATEPAAALCLRREYVNLLDSDDARLVAEHSFEACRYLWDLHGRNALQLDFSAVAAEVAYHQPCHVRAIDAGAPGPELLKLIPGMRIHSVDAGCTGMAGTWGLQKKNYRNSLRIGWPMITAMRSSPVQMAATECSACKLQIEHGVNSAVQHPLKLLAYAYGRMPEVGRLLLNES